MLDTSVILPAVISPRGYRRRFWVLLAFGALAERRDLARLQDGAPRAGAHEALRGHDIASLGAQAEARYQRLRDALPSSCPDHWRLIGSRPLLTEYERKLGIHGQDARRIDRFAEKLRSSRRQTPSLAHRELPDHGLAPGHDLSHSLIPAPLRWAARATQHLQRQHERSTPGRGR